MYEDFKLEDLIKILDIYKIKNNKKRDDVEKLLFKMYEEDIIRMKLENYKLDISYKFFYNKMYKDYNFDKEDLETIIHILYKECNLDNIIISSLTKIPNSYIELILDL